MAFQTIMKSGKEDKAKPRKRPKNNVKHSPLKKQATIDNTVSPIFPQGRAKVNEPIRCWAHTQTGNRCTSKVHSREGEPIPIPYCDRHLKNGDGALKVVSHPFAGKALVARYDLPPKYRIACKSCLVLSSTLFVYIELSS